MPGIILSVNYDENDHLVVLIDPTRQIGDTNLFADQGFNKRERNQQKNTSFVVYFFWYETKLFFVDFLFVLQY